MILTLAENIYIMIMKFIFTLEIQSLMERLLRRIDDEISSSGGKRSRSRGQIIEVFFRACRHLTVEELTRKVRVKNRNIGSATVYRTLKLLTGMGYAKELDFGEGAKRYESNLTEHHDHLVCTACGKVAEFEEPRIEELQEKVARRHGFSPTMHRLAIYGYCSRCGPSGETDKNG
jgi:Fur family ferric uptake transcriptional regulator